MKLWLDVVTWLCILVTIYANYRTYRGTKKVQAALDQVRAANAELEALNDAYRFMLTKMGVSFTTEKTPNGITIVARADGPPRKMPTH